MSDKLTKKEAIDNTIEMWEKLAETGDDKPCLGDINSDCWLCEYAEQQCNDYGTEKYICTYCPYYQKFGDGNLTKHHFCLSNKSPYNFWRDTKIIEYKKLLAKELLNQFKQLKD